MPSVKSILRERADLDRVQGHARTGQGHGRTWSTRCWPARQPEINDTKTYNNGVKVVPSYLLKPVSVDASNWKQVLIDSGYYKEAQIK